MRRVHRLRKTLLISLVLASAPAACTGPGSFDEAPPGAESTEDEAASGTWDVLIPEADDAQSMRISGSVVHMELEGGLYVLRTADGTNYNPNNLPGSYRVDGTAVEADVVIRDDMASIAMVGPIVDIVRIRATGDGSAPAAPEGDAAP